MKLASILLFAATMLAGCSGTATNPTNSVVNSMNSNAANMRGANNNTAYAVNTNQTVPPSMPSNATNISPPSMNGVTGNNKNSNTHTANENTNRKK